MQRTLTANTFIGGRLIRASPQDPVTIEVDDLDIGTMLVAPSTPIGNATAEQLVSYLRARSKLTPEQLVALILGPNAPAAGVELRTSEPAQVTDPAAITAPSTTPVERMSKPDLQALATSKGIAFDETDTKASLIEKIEAAG